MWGNRKLHFSECQTTSFQVLNSKSYQYYVASVPLSDSWYNVYKVMTNTKKTLSEKHKIPTSSSIVSSPSFQASMSWEVLSLYICGITFQRAGQTSTIISHESHTALSAYIVSQFLLCKHGSWPFNKGNVSFNSNLYDTKAFLCILSFLSSKVKSSGMCSITFLHMLNICRVSKLL